MGSMDNPARSLCSVVGFLFHGCLLEVREQVWPEGIWKEKRRRVANDADYQAFAVVLPRLYWRLVIDLWLI